MDNHKQFRKSKFGIPIVSGGLWVLIWIADVDNWQIPSLIINVAYGLAFGLFYFGLLLLYPDLVGWYKQNISGKNNNDLENRNDYAKMEMDHELPGIRWGNRLDSFMIDIKITNNGNSEGTVKKIVLCSRTVSSKEIDPNSCFPEEPIYESYADNLDDGICLHFHCDRALKPGRSLNFPLHFRGLDIDKYYNLITDRCQSKILFLYGYVEYSFRVNTRERKHRSDCYIKNYQPPLFKYIYLADNEINEEWTRAFDDNLANVSDCLSDHFKCRRYKCEDSEVFDNGYR